MDEGIFNNNQWYKEQPIEPEKIEYHITVHNEKIVTYEELKEKPMYKDLSYEEFLYMPIQRRYYYTDEIVSKEEWEDTYIYRRGEVRKVQEAVYPVPLMDTLIEQINDLKKMGNNAIIADEIKELFSRYQQTFEFFEKQAFEYTNKVEEEMKKNPFLNQDYEKYMLDEVTKKYEYYISFYEKGPGIDEEQVTDLKNSLKPQIKSMLGTIYLEKLTEAFNRLVEMEQFPNHIISEYSNVPKQVATRETENAIEDFLSIVKNVNENNLEEQIKEYLRNNYSEEEYCNLVKHEFKFDEIKSNLQNDLLNTLIMSPEYKGVPSSWWLLRINKISNLKELSKIVKNVSIEVFIERHAPDWKDAREV